MSLRREEYIRQKRKRRLWKFGFLLLFFLLVIGGLSYVSHRRALRISSVELSGGVLVTEPEVASETLLFLRGSYFGLFPKNNAYIYPRTSLEQHLASRFKRIDKIDVSLKGMNTVVVNISERKPDALWCDTLPQALSKDRNAVEPKVASTTEEMVQQVEERPTENVPETISASCYFMDSNGVVFTEAPQFSGNAYFKYYGYFDSSSPIGKSYLSSSDDFRTISSFVSQVKKLSLRPEQLVAGEAGEYTLILSGGGRLYFTTADPIDATLDNLKALLRTPVLSDPEKVGSIVDYIDLRFGNKVFYKLK